MPNFIHFWKTENYYLLIFTEITYSFVVWYGFNLIVDDTFAIVQIDNVIIQKIIKCLSLLANTVLYCGTIEFVTSRNLMVALTN